jgi:hypothetical protein
MTIDMSHGKWWGALNESYVDFDEESEKPSEETGPTGPTGGTIGNSSGI